MINPFHSKLLLVTAVVASALTVTSAKGATPAAPRFFGATAAKGTLSTEPGRCEIVAEDIDLAAGEGYGEDDTKAVYTLVANPAAAGQLVSMTIVGSVFGHNANPDLVLRLEINGIVSTEPLHAGDILVQRQFRLARTGSETTIKLIVSLPRQRSGRRPTRVFEIQSVNFKLSGCR